MSKAKTKQEKKRLKKRKEAKKRAAQAPAIVLGEHKDSKIKRLWAEHGTVRFEREDGTISSLTWQQAAKRAQSLNAAIKEIPFPDVRKEWLELIERIINVAKEAKAQAQNPDESTEKLHNLLAGKNEDGSSVATNGTVGDYLISEYSQKHPHLSEDEIALVIRSDKAWPTIAQKENVLKVVEQARIDREQGKASTEDQDLLAQAAAD